MTIDKVDLTMSSFWIQLHGLPMAGMNQYTLADIGSLVGQLLELEKLLEMNLALLSKIGWLLSSSSPCP